MVRRKHVDWLRRMKRLVDSGNMDSHLSYEILQEVRPEMFPKAARHPPKIIYPEDKLVKNFYEKYPMERLKPLNLVSDDPPLARRFAWRQLQLMQTAGMNEADSFQQTEREYVTSNSLMQFTGIKSTLTLVQMEEEKVLLNAMRMLKERKG